MKSELTPAEKIERIRKACAHGMGTHDWEHYRDGILAGKYRVFDAPRGLLITEIVQAPLKRYLNCVIGAGEMDEVLGLDVMELDREARANGCEFINAVCRLGWERVLPKHGWDKTGVVFTRVPHDPA